MSVLSELHDQIAKICPIDGLRIGDPTDPSTWLIWFQDGASEQKKTAANALLQAFANHPKCKAASDAWSQGLALMPELERADTKEKKQDVQDRVNFHKLRASSILIRD